MPKTTVSVQAKDFLDNLPKMTTAKQKKYFVLLHFTATGAKALIREMGTKKISQDKAMETAISFDFPCSHNIPGITLKIRLDMFTNQLKNAETVEFAIEPNHAPEKKRYDKWNEARRLFLINSHYEYQAACVKTSDAERESLNIVPLEYEIPEKK